MFSIPLETIFDPQITEINRMPMHVAFPSYESLSEARKGETPSNRVSLDGVWKFKLLDSVNDLTSEILEEDFGVLTGVISKCQELGQGKSRKINPITRILLCHGLATSLPMCQTITQPAFIKR